MGSRYGGGFYVNVKYQMITFLERGICDIYREKNATLFLPIPDSTALRDPEIIDYIVASMSPGRPLLRYAPVRFYWRNLSASAPFFKRRLKSATGESPLNYLQKLRIQAAKDQLENTLSSIEEISRRVGYTDGSTFRRLFKRHTSLSPREYRDRFLQVEGE